MIIDLLDRPKHLAIREISHRESLPGHYIEAYVSDCPLGCKVYESRHPDDNSVTDRVVAHNSNYGCRR